VPFTRIDPVTYAVDALRGVILGQSQFSLGLDLGIMTAFAVVVIGIGTYAFERMKV
jgi:ABC-type multidrug transport system permease subunit